MPSYMQTTSSKIWIRVADFISSDDNRYTKPPVVNEQNQKLYLLR